MRKLLPLLTLFLAVPLFADDAGNRSQSYFTYDEGGTIVRQGDDQKEVEARVNFPVYPGDEVTTSRSGRAEIRLSDGNIIALDRGTQIRFGGIRDSYDSEANGQTVIELHSGHVILERDSDDREPVRLDTESASFAATERAIYSVDTNRDRGAVRVFDGSIEVRTPSRTTRVNAGEEGRLDDQGLYNLVNLSRGGADDFERWFLGRSEIYRRGSSRYLDRSLAYSEPELDRYGSWVYANDYGWCWRPVIMSAGWRPFFNGYWHHGRGGALVWVSYEPWGWAPYHYGRWAFDPGFGWVWLPGYAYSPAWVYWMYGPGYVGWAPAGWYDCYRPYYGWAYRPYLRAGLNFGFGFWGRVRVHDLDFRPWTFVAPGHLVSSRIDRVALRNDIVRDRLGHEFATVSGAPARFSRAELRDPASAINNVARRGISTGGGREGSDMTSFFRRDASLAPALRDHIVRSRVATMPANGVATPRGVGSGIPTPGTSGTLEGRVPRDGGGSRNAGAPTSPVMTPGNSGSSWRDSGARTRDAVGSGTVRRGSDTTTTTPRDTRGTSRDTRGSNWRDRLDRPATTVEPKPPSTNTPPPPRNNDSTINRDNWRRGGNDASTSRGTVRESTRDSGRYDVPRRIIDSIGGSRIYSGGDRPARSNGGNSGNSGGGSSRGSSPPPARSNGGGGNHSSGSSGSSSGSSSHHSGGSDHKH
ncbi:MAG TPA: FecR family protein [Thermoanaerobaculia bacterium]|nr:FecR family protein [Thermoanaerobaculia bacterium]